MCNCKTCDKKDTEMCIRVIESVSHSQTETMHQIEMNALKYNYDNLLKGIEKMITLMGSESFWKVRDIEKED